MKEKLDELRKVHHETKCNLEAEQEMNLVSRGKISALEMQKMYLQKLADRYKDKFDEINKREEEKIDEINQLKETLNRA